VNKLPDGVTLQLYFSPVGATCGDQDVLFSSSKKWLHPLFELEVFLASHSVGESHDLLLRDTIVGRAAAFLILRMRLRRVETDLVSRRAIALLKEHSIEFEATLTVDAIDCMTEELLKDISDPVTAYAILSERRSKANLAVR